MLVCCSPRFNLNGERSMNSETKKFHSILESEWKSNVERYPEWATRLGDNRFNDKLNDASYETIIIRKDEATKLLDKIKEINRSSLSLEDQLNYDLKWVVSRLVLRVLLTICHLNQLLIMKIIFQEWVLSLKKLIRRLI